ncbi:MAG: aspartate--tRNA ligase [Nanoarchaeota archaeon]
MRTHTCGELSEKHLNKEATLCGWVKAIRNHGGLIFLDLWDRYGMTQVVIDPAHDKTLHSACLEIGKEWVIQVQGKVRKRKAGQAYEKLSTGKIEVLADTVVIITKAEPLPLDDSATEETRLKYRYLDIRKTRLPNLTFRSRVVLAAREHFHKHGFIDIDTPMLVKSTPEGARDYVVPSRINPGKFYALPQSPQLYKQILMIAGVDKYYQVAKCLRDEDLRQDRQPEHTQLDFEMSFVEQKDIRVFVESLYKHIFKEVLGVALTSFPVFSYKDAMNRYGSDKPDIRFGLELTDITNLAKQTDFSIFKNAEAVKCICPHKTFSRGEVDSYTELAKNHGAKGLVYAKVASGKLESSISKYISEAIQKEIIKKTGAKDGSSIMIIADTWKKTCQALGQLRNKLAEDLKLITKDFQFAWVNDFPLFSYNEDEKHWEPEHHMFSMPKKEFIADFEKRPGEVIGDLWDVCLNGMELGSGSIRVYDPALQERIMNFIGIDKKQANEKFGFLLEAYKYGAPVHGGMGLGFDRLVALMLGTKDIREVIAFPKNKNAECPMDGSPSHISEQQMKELHLGIKK